MKFTRGRSVSLTAVIITCVFFGCGPKNHLQTAKVRGTITLDGKPLDSGIIIFRPVRGRNAVGRIEPNGTYRLFTYEPSGNDGAIIGHHKVTVGDINNPLNELETTPIKHRVPLKYQNEGTSGLEFDVKDQPENVIDIILSSTRAVTKT